MLYAGECYFACMEAVRAVIEYENKIKKNISIYFKEEGVVDIIIKLFNVEEEYNYLTRNSS